MANPFIHSIPPVDAHGTGTTLSTPLVVTQSSNNATSSTTLTNPSTTILSTPDSTTLSTTTSIPTSHSSIMSGQQIPVVGARLVSSPEDTGPLSSSSGPSGARDNNLQSSVLQQAQRDYQNKPQVPIEASGGSLSGFGGNIPRDQDQDRDRDRERDRERERERDRERDRERQRERERELDRERDREKQREHEREKQREHERERERVKQQERLEREREREQWQKQRERERAQFQQPEVQHQQHHPARFTVHRQHHDQQQQQHPEGEEVGGLRAKLTSARGSRGSDIGKQASGGSHKSAESPYYSESRDQRLKRRSKLVEQEAEYARLAGGDFSQKNLGSETVNTAEVMGEKDKTRNAAWSSPLQMLKFTERVVAHPDKLFWYLFPLHLISAYFNPVGDCDETYNYWEPTHYLLYGYGFQTWEYSPVYALRSYLYILLHVMIAKVFQTLLVEALFGKAAIFYCVRATLGALTALCESQFISQVARNHRIGPTIASFLFAFLAVAPGMFHAGTAFLPQSFTMNMIMLSFTNWLSGDYDYAVFFMGLASLIGWPFSALLALPMAWDLINKCGLMRVARWGVISAAIALIPTIMVDISFYHRMVIAPLNIALYNSSSTAGANLYGVEPWTFYVKNLLLNFNFIAVLMALAVPFALLMRYATNVQPIHMARARTVWSFAFAPMLIWLGLMSSMPHKEERFLYIVYPFICLSAAYLCGEVYNILSRRMSEAPVAGSGETPEQRRNFHHSLRRLWEGGLVAAVILFSISRNLAMVHNYSAPLHVYGQLHELEHKHSVFRWPLDKEVPPISDLLSNTTVKHVCVGKEWYRFPSNFFFPAYTLPSGHTADRRALTYTRYPRADLHFLKSDFSGLLPKPYAPYPEGTWSIPTNMNDQNREEPTRYSEISVCDYIVDLDLPHQREPHYSRLSDWTVAYEQPFLDASSSSIWSRAFYVPGVSSSFNRYGSYQLLQRTPISSR